jgi:hypothetical protein
LQGLAARAGRDNLLSAAARFGLVRERASEIINEIQTIVTRAWREEVRRHGGAEADCSAIETACCYAGFEYPTDGDR